MTYAFGNTLRLGIRCGPEVKALAWWNWDHGSYPSKGH